MRFGFFYLNGRLTVYDVSVDFVYGRPTYVAALSEDPRVCFHAPRAEHAVEQLKAHLEHFSRSSRLPAVTWMPHTPEAFSAT